MGIVDWSVHAPDWAVFDDLTARQIAGLGNVAFGQHGAGLHSFTLVRLANLGLIVPEVVEEQTRQGRLRYTRWEMPLPVHIAFCEWCSKQPDLPGDDDDE